MKKTKKILALCLSLLLLLSLTACGKSKEVKNVEELISAIGVVTADKAEAVAAAEKAFAALSPEDREKVENAGILPEAREALDVVLTEDLIDAIGKVTEESEEAVLEAEKAFAALTEEAKEKVANAGILSKAREELDAALASTKILGTWEAESDLIDTLVESVDSSLGDYDFTFADYLDSFPVPVSLELREDGTYSVSSNRAKLEDTFVVLKEATMNFYSDLFLMILSEQMRASGLGTFSTWEEIEDYFGMDKDALFVQFSSMSLSDLVDSVLGDDMIDMLMDEITFNGQFKAEDGKLFLSRSESAEPDSNPYDYVLDGNTLTLTGFNGEDMLGLEYPVVFERAG